jgi:hypothetical protein
MKHTLGAIALATVITCTIGCASARDDDDDARSVNIPRHAFALAETNRANVNKVRLRQTLAEVEKIMGPPERRAARLRYDGVSIEEWSYITDYIRKSDALILFVGGKVEEIQSTPWDEGEDEDEAAKKPR